MRLAGIGAALDNSQYAVYTYYKGPVVNTTPQPPQVYNFCGPGQLNCVPTWAVNPDPATGLLVWQMLGWSSLDELKAYIFSPANEARFPSVSNTQQTQTIPNIIDNPTLLQQWQALQDYISSQGATPPTSGIVAPGVPATPTAQQIAGGQTVAGNAGTQITNVGAGGFTMPTVLTEASVGGIPNWMLLVGAFAALMLFKK